MILQPPANLFREQLILERAAREGGGPLKPRSFALEQKPRHGHDRSRKSAVESCRNHTWGRMARKILEKRLPHAAEFKRRQLTRPPPAAVHADCDGIPFRFGNRALISERFEFDRRLAFVARGFPARTDDGCNGVEQPAARARPRAVNSLPGHGAKRGKGLCVEEADELQPGKVAPASFPADRRVEMRVGA